MTLASPVLSLSCLPPDVVASYGTAAEAEERYIVVHGTLRFNQGLLPKAIGNDSPPSTRIKAHFSGKSLSQAGFINAFDRDITLDVACFGPWCAGASSGEEYLLFLRKDVTEYTYAADPCGRFGFARPTPEMLRQVTQCISGGPCSPSRR
ncbi:MAG: hypothetical protein AB8B82_08305 [Roseovarius sp.]